MEVHSSAIGFGDRVYGMIVFRQGIGPGFGVRVHGMGVWCGAKTNNAPKSNTASAGMEGVGTCIGMGVCAIRRGFARGVYSGVYGMGAHAIGIGMSSGISVMGKGGRFGIRTGTQGIRAGIGLGVCCIGTCLCGIGAGVGMGMKSISIITGICGGMYGLDSGMDLRIRRIGLQDKWGQPILAFSSVKSLPIKCGGGIGNAVDIGTEVCDLGMDDGGGLDTHCGKLEGCE